eukprot:GHVS01036666.1.p1 GENE.GHVS01036666.1~~GHVS01036666.1.p1  ORF type:complete len:144 (-),score=10.58 GHVS01036666.1:329-760(-)
MQPGDLHAVLSGMARDLVVHFLFQQHISVGLLQQLPLFRSLMCPCDLHVAICSRHKLLYVLPFVPHTGLKILPHPLSQGPSLRRPPSSHSPSYALIMAPLDLHVATSSSHLLPYVLALEPQTGNHMKLQFFLQTAASTNYRQT